VKCVSFIANCIQPGTGSLETCIGLKTVSRRIFSVLVLGSDALVLSLVLATQCLDLGPGLEKNVLVLV